jgi:hypothetical protein
MKLKKWVKWTVGSVVVASGIVVGAYQTTAWVMGNAKAYESTEKARAEVLKENYDAIKVTDEEPTIEETTNTDTVDVDPVNEVAGINDTEGTELVDQWVDGQWWNDIDVQETIHKMSHQKIIASMKRGSIQITQKRLENLSKAIDQNKDHLESYDIYREILDRWIKGDFSQADQDHNAIWEMMDGEIGKATGVASKEQEKEYIQNTFGDGQ